MDHVVASPFPHLSWLGATFSFRAGAPPTGIHLRSVTHSVSITLSGRHALRWIRRGRERRWIEQSGTVHFRPCDGEWNDFVVQAAESGEVFACFIPAGQMAEIACTEALQCDDEGWPRLLVHDDAVLQRALLTLAECRACPGESVGRADEAARRLVLRLVELSGGGRPDWHADASVFDTRTLAHLVGYVDAHLKLAPSLGEMGLRTGLSPSHFARKFRRSTGQSLHRFVNRRRIAASLDMLRGGAASLAGVALDLGFSSQSHFTRLFSDLTGMTPAKYRKQCRRK